MLKDGGSFGELALLQNKPRYILLYIYYYIYRNASMLAKTDCHLGILKREAFEKLTRDSELKITAAIRNFMLSLPYFRQCTVFQIYRVNFIFELVQFVNNNTIYTIGEDPEYVYIVKNGEFEVYSNIYIYIYIYRWRSMWDIISNKQMKRNTEKLKRSFTRSLRNIRVSRQELSYLQIYKTTTQMCIQCLFKEEAKIELCKYLRYEYDILY